VYSKDEVIKGVKKDGGFLFCCRRSKNYYPIQRIPWFKTKNPKTQMMMVSHLRFSQNSIAERFSCGRRLEESIEDMLCGKFPFQIKVVEKEGKLYSLDNRRLYILKHGHEEIVEVEMVDEEKKSAEEISRMNKKFTTENDGTEIRVRWKNFY
jgi:hypothetical protein